MVRRALTVELVVVNRLPPPRPTSIEAPRFSGLAGLIVATSKASLAVSGIGFAGDPHKPEVAPIVTVRIVGAQYNPITLSPFGGSVDLPDFSYSLTLEDGEGTASS